MLQAKAEIRQQILIQLGHLTPHRTNREGHELAKILQQDRLFQNAKKIALFYPLWGEVDTQAIHKAIISKNKIPLYPKMDFERKVLRFHVVKDLKDFHRGPYQVFEPKQDSLGNEQKDIDLFLVPGLAFSKDGARLGRGAGFYDRTLIQCHFWGIPRYGICFPEQILPYIPMGEKDLRMHKVFTPEEEFVVSLPGDFIERN